MKTFIFLITFFLSLNISAGTKVYEDSEDKADEKIAEKVPVKKGYEPLDMTAKGGQKKIHGACTDITGQTINPGDAGYETCIQKVNTDPNHKGPGNNLNMIYDSAD